MIIKQLKTIFFKESQIILNSIKKLLFHFLIEIFSNLYLMSSFFRLLCYTRLTLNWFTTFNPNTWPYSFITNIVNPYFYFWSTKIPFLRSNIGVMDVSVVLALQIVNLSIWTFLQIVLKLQSFENQN